MMNVGTSQLPIDRTARNPPKHLQCAGRRPRRAKVELGAIRDVGCAASGLTEPRWELRLKPAESEVEMADRSWSRSRSPIGSDVASPVTPICALPCPADKPMVSAAAILVTMLVLLQLVGGIGNPEGTPRPPAEPAGALSVHPPAIAGASDGRASLPAASASLSGLAGSMGSTGPSFGYGWEQWSPNQDCGSATYDDADGYVLYYGDCSAVQGSSQTTWTFDGGGWSRLPTNGSPPPLQGPSLVYDGATRSVLLFGGIDPTTYGGTNETWSFSHGNWTQLRPPVAPSPRGFSQMVYDAADRYVLLLGGISSLVKWPSSLNDSWTFANGTWTAGARAPGFTGTEGGLSVAYDNADGYVVGVTPAATLEYRRGSWNATHPSPAPTNRTLTNLVYDSAAGRVLMLGGFDSSGRELADLWNYSAGRWSEESANTTPILSEYFAPVAVFDRSTDQVIFLAGGDMVQLGGSTRSTTWVYANSTWTAVPTAITPFTQCCGGIAFDPADNETVLVGGFVYGNNTVSDFNSNSTWIFSNYTWKWIPTNSTFRGRYGASLVYDAADGYLMLFGGDAYGAFGYAPQTWRFDAGVWSLVHTSATPGGRDGAAIAYDAADGYALLFGGDSSGRYLSDTWTYKNGTWTNLTSSLTSSPSARAGAAMAYDAQDGYVVLYGGGGKHGDHNDTWTFANGTWTNITLSAGAPPSPRDSAAVAYVPTQGYVLLYGGGNFYSGLNPYFGSLIELSDTWTFSGGAWAAANPAESPSARSGAVATFDPNLGSVVMYGGESDYASLASTWGWASAGPLAPGTLRSSPAMPEANQSLRLTAGSSGGSGRDGYAWSGLPSGCLTSNASQLSCVPTRSGSYNVSVNITDEISWTSVSETLTQLTVARSLAAGALTATSAALDVEQNLSLSGTALYGIAPFSYAWTGLPAGCSSMDQGAITCVPTTSGLYRIGLQIGDADGAGVADASISVTVSPGLSAGRLSADRTVVDLGESLSIQAMATGGDLPRTIVWNGTPAGCATASGDYLNCTPTASGEWNVSAVIIDSSGESVPAGPISIQVLPPPRVTGFAVSPTATDVGTSVTFSVTEMGGASPYSASFTGLPPGCSSTNALVLRCSPSAAGTFAVTVGVTDSLGERSAGNATLVVNLPPSITSLTASPRALEVGQTVTFSGATAGGTGTIVWNYSGLPPGCPMASGPILECTPTAAGNYTVAVRAIDAVGVSDGRTISVNISAQLSAGPFTATPSRVVLGGQVTFSLPIEGGTAPYDLAFSGLWSDCRAAGRVFACTATAFGEFNITGTVSDAAGARTLAQVSVAVSPTPLAVLSFTALPSEIQLGESTVLAVRTSGGAAPFNVSFAGLPLGCIGSNSLNLSCTPSDPGSFTITLTVHDAVQQVATAELRLIVDRPAIGGGGNGTLGSRGFPLLPFGALIGAVALTVLVVLIVVAVRRRGRRGRASDPGALPSVSGGLEPPPD